MGMTITEYILAHAAGQDAVRVPNIGSAGFIRPRNSVELRQSLVKTRLAFS